MTRFLERLYGRRFRGRQAGITGTETAVVLAAGAAVLASLAVAAYAVGGIGGGDKVYENIQEANAGLEPRGSVIGFTGTLADGGDAVYKIGFVVAGAPDAEPVDFTPSHSADGAGIDPDPAGPAALAVRYKDASGETVDLPWTATFLGFSDGDTVLETDEKVQVTAWLLDRDNAIAITDPGAVGLSPGGAGTPLSAGDSFTVEVEVPDGGVLAISRTVPDSLSPVIDMR